MEGEGLAFVNEAIRAKLLKLIERLVEAARLHNQREKGQMDLEATLAGTFIPEDGDGRQIKLRQLSFCWNYLCVGWILFHCIPRSLVASSHSGLFNIFWCRCYYSLGSLSVLKSNKKKCCILSSVLLG